MTTPDEVSQTAPRVVLPPLAAPVDELWHVVLDLSEQLTVPWTLVGGQMVLLHALQHGVVPPNVSQDADVIADVRARPAALRQIVATLDTLGFTLEGASPDGIAHRYLRGNERPVKVDVLAPEGLDPRTMLTTTPPGRTVQVPGGTQALSRTELVQVVHEDRTGRVPRPSLLAAIVGKAAACGLPGDSRRHCRDLALLSSLVADPFVLAADVDRTDRRRLRIAKALTTPTHAGWLALPATARAAAQATYLVLADLDPAQP